MEQDNEMVAAAQEPQEQQWSVGGVHPNRTTTNSNNNNPTNHDDDNGWMVQAPVEAIQVTIDGDDSTRGFTPLETIGPPNNNDHSHRAKSQRNGLLAILGFVLVAVCIGVVVVTTTRPASNDDGSSMAAGDTTTPTTTESAPPTTAPIAHPYPCYTSTKDIFEAQLTRFNDTTNSDDEEVYVLCPNTVIPIGTYANPSLEDFRLVGGDMPLIIIRSNVTVQCGLDGKSSNNCTLIGGYVQTVLQSFVLTEDNIIDLNIDESLDNILIQGVTFSGQLDNAGPFPGTSVIISHPTHSLRFVDCNWVDLVAPVGLIGVFHNDFSIQYGFVVDDLSMEVVLSECRFENIVYDRSLIYARQQRVIVDRCVFRNIRVNFLPSSGEDCGYSIDVGGAFTNGCAGLLYCGIQAHCTVHNVCLDRVQYRAPGVFHAAVSATVDIDSAYVVVAGPANGTDSGGSSMPASLGCELAIREPNQPDQCRDVLVPTPSCPDFV